MSDFFSTNGKCKIEKWRAKKEASNVKNVNFYPPNSGVDTTEGRYGGGKTMGLTTQSYELRPASLWVKVCNSMHCINETNGLEGLNLCFRGSRKKAWT